jgi:hypothetical protein
MGNMKNTFYFYVAVILVAIAVPSCDGPDGPNGRNGNAYVDITSSDGTLNSDGLFSSFPPTFYVDQYYSTNPGVYDFSFTTSYYDSHGNFYSRDWGGTYSITINDGSPGGDGKLFWQHGDPGSDGPDEYYKLNCTYDYGLDAYYHNYLFKTAVAKTDTLVGGKVYIRDLADARYKIHIECQMKNRSIKK